LTPKGEIVVCWIGKHTDSVLRIYRGAAAYRLWKWYLRLPEDATQPEAVYCSKFDVSALYHIKLPNGDAAPTVLCVQYRYVGKKPKGRWEAFVLLSEEDKKRFAT